jgi:nicotinate-nucleotide adenylyltransferase
VGHLAAAEDAAYSLSLDRVLFVPNRQPPHKAGLKVSPVQDRVAMVELATVDNALFDVSLIELNRPGPSYTLDTLRELRRLRPPAEIFFLVGCDALFELHTWHEPQQLLEEFRLVVMDRPTGKVVDWSVAEKHFPQIRRQVTVVHVAQLEISSSDIRARVQASRPIRYQVPPAVQRYIDEKGLYR